MADDELTPEERKLLLKQWLKWRGQAHDPQIDQEGEAVEALRQLRLAAAQETDPPTKAHIERTVKLLDPRLRDAYIKTLGPGTEP